MELKLQRLDKDLPLPGFAYAGDAAFDLYARETMTLVSGEKVVMPTGIALAIPEGYVGLVWDKGGIGANKGIKTLGGVIDAGYRGEVIVGLVNLSKDTHTFERGDKVAQMIIQERICPDIVEVDELDETERGDGKFGSSGK